MFYTLSENWPKLEDPGKQDPEQCQTDLKVSYMMSSGHKKCARICDSARQNVSTSNAALVKSILHVCEEGS